MGPKIRIRRRTKEQKSRTHRVLHVWAPDFQPTHTANRYTHWYSSVRGIPDDPGLGGVANQATRQPGQPVDSGCRETRIRIHIRIRVRNEPKKVWNGPLPPSFFLLLIKFRLFCKSPQTAPLSYLNFWPGYARMSTKIRTPKGKSLKNLKISNKYSNWH